MSGPVVRLDPATHKVVDTLLPWFVNGTLDADERVLVERHVAQCARCRQEVEWLRALHAACVAGEASSEGSSAFRKLRRRLETPRRRAGRVSPGFLRAPWTHWVIGAQLVLIAGLGTLTFQDTFQDADRAGRYRTLGVPSTAVPARGTLVVVFDPNTSEAELRRVLREADARVVDGPTSSNAYVLDVAASRQAQALQALRAERAVTLAEELAPRSAR
jgi:anti-sigma factor RsiW